ncbi:protein involved in polysaccharide export with SLBB domain [Humitalea rosea]|uniref:Protein involved in polysaccharide export with SLBB domain n=1 Tax=Humitalea rosea TaxID=990373 RepID=A0A2W7I8P5_9PROT|nr:polysaccharide biosynthesis/export family protein [Humitalea rosea]PZW41892.1 protein involved in polysaccharide export with SLBB domain [Humitalea rosea]
MSQWRNWVAAVLLIGAALPRPALAQLLPSSRAGASAAQSPAAPQSFGAPLGFGATGSASQAPITPNLLGQERTTVREGSATEAEGGPTVTAPLGEVDRRPGPPTAVFGAALFTRPVTLSSDAPNPSYVLSPGDRVSIRIWGATEAEITSAVDSDGNIFIPTIGPVAIAGTRAGDLQRVIEQQVQRIYTQSVQVYAVLLNVNRIGVFVAGAVKMPGRHVGQASDSVLDFLTRAGGVDPSRGSFRQIELRRSNGATSRIDLYSFLTRGVLPPIRLQEGDTILVGAQSAMVSVDGAIRNNYLFEMTGRSMAGRELIELAAPLPSATNVVVRGTRNTLPWSRYATVRELAGMQLHDQDSVTFISDVPNPSIRVSIEGSRIGPSVLIADRDITLCQLLDHVAVDPQLADTGAVFLLRPRLAAAQVRSINEALDRLERQLFTAMSASTGVAEIRASEAQLVSTWISRGRRIRPEGRLVVAQNRHCTETRLEDGDTIVIPERVETVMVSGEVNSPQAVLWRRDRRIADYITAAGGFDLRADESRVIIRRASGEVLLDPAEGPSPGDELIVLPRLDPKNFQIARDLLNLVFQSAVAVRVFN